MFTEGLTAQRRNIIIFSSVTLHIEFRLKIFEPVFYPPGSNPHKIVILAYFLAKL